MRARGRMVGKEQGESEEESVSEGGEGANGRFFRLFQLFVFLLLKKPKTETLNHSFDPKP